MIKSPPPINGELEESLSMETLERILAMAGFLLFAAGIAVFSQVLP